MSASTPLTHGIAPSGALRVGIAVGPAGSATWAIRGPDGAPRGITVDLGRAMAEALGVGCVLVEHASSGAIVEAAGAGTWDVAFTPVDAERKKHVDFGPNYFLGESTYMAAPGTPYRTVEDVDQAGVRVVGVENTATIRSARRTLRHTEARGVAGLDEAVALVRAGEADAVALGRESILSLLPAIPGARIVSGHFHAAGTAVCVPQGYAAALAFASGFIERAKEDGTLRRIFDANGMAEAAVAPAGSRS